MNLKVEHVTKKFKDKIAVDDLSIELSSGVYGLIGENGAGKTTLMNLICGILTPTQGSITFNNIPIDNMGASYRSLLGYLPQEFVVGREFSVIDYLKYISALKGLDLRYAQKKIDELIVKLSLETYQTKKIFSLSGGTRRRVGIAQALLNDPEILILDEPTTGLDPSERARFRKMIAELANERIILISTHIVSDIEYISSHNAIMKNGKLVGYGSTNDLTKPLVGKVWRIQIQESDYDNFTEQYYVLNTRKNENNDMVVRFICEQHLPGAIMESPQLEDVVLWRYMRGGEENIC